MPRTTKTIYRAFVEPDFDYIAGSRRRRLPPASLRAIPLAGVILGALVAGYTGFGFYAGVMGGSVAGLVVYQVVAHRWSRR